MCNKGITEFYLPPTHEPYLLVCGSVISVLSINTETRAVLCVVHAVHCEDLMCRNILLLL